MIPECWQKFQSELAVKKDLNAKRLAERNRGMNIRNKPCPCKSGLKWKKCCGVAFYAGMQDAIREKRKQDKKPA